MDPEPHPPAPARLLEVERVRYAYGTHDVLHELTFAVDAGELVAVVGRNGAGKTTLLRCLAGWSLTTGGRIRVAGQTLPRDERALRGTTILVPDTPRFYDDLTAWEHLQLIGQAHRRAGWAATAEDLLTDFGLWPDRRALCATLSRGTAYKLALSLAFLACPRLLLLDEPFGPLDPVAATHLWRQLQECRAQGMGILVSSHQLPAGAEPDRYLVLEQGYLIAEGSSRELGRSLHLESASLDGLLRAVLDRHTRQGHGH
jgi:ABC-2 type transport system ATP-binding protein